ncbi:uncharacterized protein PRCAT00000268001 [Priceomyces carsonii]|uniref:uncharacterized protein n=1 Tax=Priceomyces carsonii TaxID=28549 RepID=UPI002ED95D53|nr:unnamed protein product [Priceomyces carsonii]
MNTHIPLGTDPTNKELDILCINFNQDQGCFAVGHQNGFLVYNTNPIDLRVKRNFNLSGGKNGGGSGIGHITMLHRTNYLALVGGGKNPKFASNKLVIWDDLKRKDSLTLEFTSPVLNVLLSRIRIIVVLKNQVLVYGFSSPPKKFASYETVDNEYGLADLSVNSSSISSQSLNSSSSSVSSSSFSSSDGTKYQTLAFPGRSIGQIQLVDVSPQGQEKNLVSIIKSHKSKIRCLALNRSGTLIASASETGTIIRIHSTHNTALLYEFRRGLDRAIVTSMKFSHDDSKLAVLSDKSTLHIFNIPPISEGPETIPKSADSTPVNRQHLLKRISIPIPIPNYFKSTWSFCSVNTNKHHLDSAEDYCLNDVGVLGWSGNDSVIIIWKEKKLWEKYVIVETNNTKDMDIPVESRLTLGLHWDIVRVSWKSLKSVQD